MKITILGSGTSQGVPVIGCDCHVCRSEDRRDNRLRSSILVEGKSDVFVVDTGPDFRQQMLRESVKHIDAIVFTHAHKDHIAGLDDVRAFNYIQRRPMDIYCSEDVEKELHREFYYVFERDKYPGVPSLNLNHINGNDCFSLPGGTEIRPIQVYHYKMPVLGFRIGEFTYITDAKTVAPEEIEKIKGTRVLIVNALRREPHVSHFNLEQALAFIDEVKPHKAYLTHISHLFDTHEAIEVSLPDNVHVAYDGLVIEIDE